MASMFDCEECGKTFVNTAGLFTHQKKKCRPGKRSLKELLSDARDYWKSVNKEVPRKRQRVESSRDAGRRKRQSKEMNDGLQDSDPHSVPPGIELPDTILNHADPHATSIGASNLAGSVSQTVLAQEHLPSQHTAPGNIDGMRSPSTNLRFTSWRDKFGVFKKFWSSEKPHHDPDASTATPRTNARSTEFQRESEVIPDPAKSIHDVVVNHNALFKGNLDVLETDPTSRSPSYYPYPNWSSFALGDWYWNGGVLNSKERFGDLLRILRHENFRTEDVCKTSWNLIHRILPQGVTPPDIEAAVTDKARCVDDSGSGWTSKEVVLEVPFPTRGRGGKSDSFTAGVLHYRPIVSVIKERITDPGEFNLRHLQPFELLWQPNLQKDPVRIYGELYTSDEFFRVHNKIQAMEIDDPRNVGLERVVVAIMFWSDATLLANFGSAKLWPCYMFLGNDSKYRRAKPSTNLCSHIAYFEELPDSFKDWYRSKNRGANPSQDLMTHCDREMFHRQWDILLDDQLVHAMRNGIRIDCPDGVTRLFFPWIFTYSADYPEKAMIGTIRSLGQKPCPRCLVQKCDIHQMGLPPDMSLRNSQIRTDNDARQQQVESARARILVEGYAVRSKQVENILKEDSLVPVRNAFSKLSHLGFDVYPSLVVDLMHEFELGVWKALFIHLIRILEAYDRCTSQSTTVHELDMRYRQMPSFGVDTIRKFSSNASERKRLGARDYENLLQCAIPAFEGLLPEPHNSIICRLLFLQFSTVETSSEYANRLKRANKSKKKRAKTTKKATSSSHPSVPVQVDGNLATPCQVDEANRDGNRVFPMQVDSQVAPTGIDNPVVHPPMQDVHLLESPAVPEVEMHSGTPQLVHPRNVATSRSAPKGKQCKTFNVDTYKYHALADFAPSIRRFGTADSYSTERGELEHKLPKSWFLRTDKKTFRIQLARIERRRANLRKIRRRVRGEGSTRLIPSAVAHTMNSDDASPYAIAKSQNSFKTTKHFRATEANKNDPAYKVRFRPHPFEAEANMSQSFLPDLKKHLLPRIEEVLLRRHPGDSLPEVPEKNWSYVSLRDNRIYEHKTLRARYTTYDLRQEEEVIRIAGPKAYVMVLNPSYSGQQDSHPFLYARVQGIYHANVLYMHGAKDPDPERLDFLWVRWLQWKGKSHDTHGLDVVTFPPVTEEGAFGFLNPADVVRGCHIVPRFSDDDAVLQESRSKAAKDSEDSPSYFVDPFADRDIYMRYHWGHAVGHEYAHSSACPPQAPATLAELTGAIPVTQSIPLSPPSSLDFPPPPVEQADVYFNKPGCGDIGESGDDDIEEPGDDDIEELGEDDMVFRGSDYESESDEESGSDEEMGPDAEADSDEDPTGIDSEGD